VRGVEGIDVCSPEREPRACHRRTQSSSTGAPAARVHIAAGSPPKAIERPQGDDAQQKQPKITLFGWGVPTVSKGRGDAH
jgi:hypothetical protein